MEDKAAELVALYDRFQKHTDRSHWQISRDATGSAKFFRDLREGTRTGCTVGTYDRAICWFWDNWPTEAAWPEEISPPKGKSKDDGSLGAQSARRAQEDAA